MRYIRGQKGGFTLLETLIAFSVFSLFTIAVHKSFISGVKGQEAADWSNMVGLKVRAEFSQIEAGLADARFYRKELDEFHRLEVEISYLSLDRVAVPVATHGIHMATIKVRNLEDHSEQVFEKIVSMRED